MAGKIALYEGIGDIFGRRVSRGGSDGRPTKRRHSRHNIKSPAVKRQNEKMKACARSWRKHKGSRPYREFMKTCLHKLHLKP